MSTKKDVSEDISVRMKAIGDKYADRILNEKPNENANENEISLKRLDKYFQISLRAYKMVLDIDREKHRIIHIDVVKEFSSLVVERTLRSDVYRKFLAFCEAADLEPVARNTLYEKLRELKFQKKKMHGGWYLTPPKTAIKSELLTKVRPKLKTMEIVADDEELENDQP